MVALEDRMRLGDVEAAVVVTGDDVERRDELRAPQFRGLVGAQRGQQRPAADETGVGHLLGRAAHSEQGDVVGAHGMGGAVVVEDEFAVAVTGLLAAKLGHHFGQAAAFCDAVAMHPMGRGDIVRWLDGRTGPNGCRLFSGIEVRGPLDDVLREQLHHFLFEEPNFEHLPEIRQQRLFVFLNALRHKP